MPCLCLVLAFLVAAIDVDSFPVRHGGKSYGQGGYGYWHRHGGHGGYGGYGGYGRHGGYAGNVAIKMQPHSATNRGSILISAAVSPDIVCVPECRMDTIRVATEHQMETIKNVAPERQMNTTKMVATERQMNTKKTVAMERQMDMNKMVATERQVDTKMTVATERQMDMKKTMATEHQMDMGKTVTTERQMDMGKRVTTDTNHHLDMITMVDMANCSLGLKALQNALLLLLSMDFMNPFIVHSHCDLKRRL
ncbi:uncharacterized protein LOC129716391 isoform X3 [Leucoraja erinacea]|uniref:uncharacterized protein LOC129716391 isoform X3 n=1 Tax=Leucoraja erinaceus TaxID=7782 RepID=UPI0024591159|nr:uncharacterized protein LOC129716391 isoform X3 [Leucoraja erinacea]